MWLVSYFISISVWNLVDLLRNATKKHFVFLGIWKWLKIFLKSDKVKQLFRISDCFWIKSIGWFHNSSRSRKRNVTSKKDVQWYNPGKFSPTPTHSMTTQYRSSEKKLRICHRQYHTVLIYSLAVVVWFTVGGTRQS